MLSAVFATKNLLELGGDECDNLNFMNNCSIIILTRSSADADNRLDAFISGQSSPCHK